MEAIVKKEPIQAVEAPVKEESSSEASKLVTFIDLSSSDSDFDNSDDSDDDVAAAGKNFEGSGGINGSVNKKRKLDDLGIILPPGFLEPLPPEEPLPIAAPVLQSRPAPIVNSSKQFWKAGEFDDDPAYDSLSSSTVGMAHLRVHPKFLHSNATSHKWALGAIAELLDNSLDEVCNGATFVNIDMMNNIKDGSRMLVIEDNGGGMDPDKMRQCMSLGYSSKSKFANTIGQYGNGFKTSTMRLGADVIVFSRCRGKDGKSPTQSIGMLSYTFLRSTKKEDIVVPMLDFEKVGMRWNKLMQSSSDWNSNLETILYWSPYSSEVDLLNQFNLMNDQGTRIIIYNLWEDDEGELELDFDTDPHDIELRGVNRDEKKIEMAKQFPNSRHFLTYQHSLRSYASILYLRLPCGFRIILRGKDVEHHNIVNDLMLVKDVTYKPKHEGDGVPRYLNMVAVVTVGFVKDANHHIDVQGFNVYHKNRLIKPFWRVWNAAGSDGRGVIGVLEANFVEPAHDKQGFERTTVLSRLEARLVQMQKTYWSTYCHKIGYAPRRHKKQLESESKESSPEYFSNKSSQYSKKKPIHPRDKDQYHNFSNQKQIGKQDFMGKSGLMNSSSHRVKSSCLEPTSCFAEEDNDYNMQNIGQNSMPNGSAGTASPSQRFCERRNQHPSQLFSQNSDNTENGVGHSSNGRVDLSTIHSQKKAADVISSQNGNAISGFSSVELDQLKIENSELRKRLKNIEESSSHSLEFESPESLGNIVGTDSERLSLIQLKTENLELKTSLKKMETSTQIELQFERDRCRSLQAQLKESEEKIAELNKEQEALIDIFSEERNRRDIEEENLRKKLKDASNTIQQLLDKIRALEKMKSP